ncbi:MAG: phosphonate C-P lyase system protein PhnL [Hyphomicrobiales bacterium]
MTGSDKTPLIASNLAKSFTMHLRDGIKIPVIDHVNFSLEAGKCCVLGGASGAGKSSILKMLYGNYGVDQGQILVNHQGELLDFVVAEPRKIISIRRHTIGYVSQFLRVVPRISALDVVADPLVEMGMDHKPARKLAEDILARLNLPENLWSLPPSTFSGGEQQRVNIARGFITDHPILLLDEPTASLDATNRQVVIELIGEKKAKNVALLGIFHDEDVRNAVADTIIDVTNFSARRAA